MKFHGEELRLEKLIRLAEDQYVQAGINWKKIIRQDPCVYCGRQASELPRRRDGRAMTTDHIRPVGRGGSHAWHNRAASCYECTTIKGTTRPCAI